MYKNKLSLAQCRTSPRPHIAIVPAAPGWYALEPVIDDANAIREFVRAPIVAWKIETNAVKTTGATFESVTAITAEGDVRDQRLQTPDNLYLIPFVGEFETEAALLSYLNDNRRAKAVDRVGAQGVSQS